MSGVPSIWADIDYHAPGAHQRDDLPADAAAAIAVIRDATPVLPSLIIDSGYGFYAEFLFREFLHFDGEEERERCASLLHRYDYALRSKANGAHVDAVKDLARVLKVPGTINWKVPGDPRLVHIVHDTGHRFTMDDWTRMLRTFRMVPLPSRNTTAVRVTRSCLRSWTALSPFLQSGIAKVRDITRPFTSPGTAAGLVSQKTTLLKSFGVSASTIVCRRMAESFRGRPQRLRDGKPVSGYCGLRDTVGIDEISLKRLERLRGRFRERTRPSAIILIGGLRARPARLRVREVRHA